MSLVHDHVRRIDSQIDRFQLLEGIQSAATAIASQQHSDRNPSFPRLGKLQALSRALSTSTSSSPLLKRRRVANLLVQARHNGKEDDEADEAGEDAASADAAGHQDVVDMEWIVLAKASIQVYGMIMETLLRETIPLSEELWYWDRVLGSYYRTGLYIVQSAPVRLWGYARDIYADAIRKYRTPDSLGESSGQAAHGLSDSWRRFYDLVQDSIQDRSMVQARTKILSPFALHRTEARRKQNGLRRLREMNATGLGILIDEGLCFAVSAEDMIGTPMEGSPSPSQDEWRTTVAKSISLMESVLRNVNTLDAGISEFEEGVFTSVEQDPEIVSTSSESNGGLVRAGQLTDRLLVILTEHLPGQEQRSTILSQEYGRPSRLVRYWPLATFFLIFGSTILRIVANRRADIKVWIQEFGATVIDFWSNWIVDPVKKLIATIRHDEGNEVAIMSRDSLKADRESLERMVVDFAYDHPNETGASYAESDIEAIRAKVKEGDLTPVLKAYERDLRKPFMGTVRGDLVRALLIQVQKTKVDVEVAIGGIDSLLKSQELVFGLVGLTPGLLIAFAAFRWLGDIFGSRKGLQKNRKQGETIRLLRNIDRVLITCSPTGNGLLTYKDHGLLLCEVDELRRRAQAIIPSEIYREFLEDVNDLSYIRYGVQRQIKVLERIQWAYAKWLR